MTSALVPVGPFATAVFAVALIRARKTTITLLYRLSAKKFSIVFLLLTKSLFATGLLSV